MKPSPQNRKIELGVGFPVMSNKILPVVSLLKGVFCSGVGRNLLQG